jgi:hypothetical protein
LAKLPDKSNAYTTVATWLPEGQVPGAVPQAIGDISVWTVPEEAVHTFKIYQPRCLSNLMAKQCWQRAFEEVVGLQKKVPQREQSIDYRRE